MAAAVIVATLEKQKTQFWNTAATHKKKKNNSSSSRRKIERAMNT